MRLDNEQILADAQAPTAVAATASTNILDLGAGSKRKGGGAGPMEPLFLYSMVTTTFTSGGSATMSVTLQSDDDVAFGSPTTVAVTAAIPVASLVAGFEFQNLDLAKVTERYVRAVFTIATAVMTAGKITAFIATPSQIQRGVGQA